jgi:hypothetical protein
LRITRDTIPKIRARRWGSSESERKQRMTQGIAWLVTFLAIALMVWALVRENERRRRRSVEDFERDFAAGQGKLAQFMRAGALGMEAILMDEKRQAIAHQKDEEQGTTKTGGKNDDVDRTASEE